MPTPSSSSCSSRPGQCCQVVSGEVPSVEWRRAVPLLPAPTAPTLSPLPVGPDAPGPSVDTFVPGTDIHHCLRTRRTSLPPAPLLPSLILRAKIMARHYINLSLLLKPSLVQPQEYSLSINSGVTNPTFCESPAKPKDEVLSFEQWGSLSADMSVYLLQPANLPCAVKMLKYMEMVRGLVEEGGNWRSYDAALRNLRGRWGGPGTPSAGSFG